MQSISVVAVPHQTVHAEMHFFCQLAQSARQLMVSTNSTYARAQGVITVPLLFPKEHGPDLSPSPPAPEIGAISSCDSWQCKGRLHRYRYCWARVTRSPGNPCRSTECCQERNSSTVSRYRAHASSRGSSPPRTATTISALRRITHRVVPGGGKSLILNGLPFGPRTYLGLGLNGSTTNSARATAILGAS